MDYTIIWIIFEIIHRGNDGCPGPVREENVVAAEAAEEVGVDAAAAIPPPPVAPPPANVVVFPPIACNGIMVLLRDIIVNTYFWLNSINYVYRKRLDRGVPQMYFF